MHATYHLAWTTARRERERSFPSYSHLQQQTLGMTTWSDMNNSGRKVLLVFSEHQQRNESGRVSKLGKNRKVTSGARKKKIKVHLRKARFFLRHSTISLLCAFNHSEAPFKRRRSSLFLCLVWEIRISLVFISLNFYLFLRFEGSMASTGERGGQ